MVYVNGVTVSLKRVHATPEPGGHLAGPERHAYPRLISYTGRNLPGSKWEGLKHETWGLLAFMWQDPFLRCVLFEDCLELLTLTQS